jgi:SAM-dependent methyltransferase
VEISTSADDHQRVLPFVQIHDWKTRLPVPPKENIERVSGFGANAYIYFSNGASDFTRFLRTAADHGFDALSENTRILDWGCGCGRLTRWFADRGAGQYVGVDVDAENIAWCKENIQGADFETIGLYPPTDLERQSFDLVIGNSVLTHLTRETMEKWLAEIRRVLKPDSVALLSFHGDFSNAYLVSRYKDAMLNILDTGCYDKLIGKEMEGVLSDPDYYRQTYFSDDFAVKAFRAAGFEVETVLVGHVSRCQNLAVLRAVHNSG